MIRTKGEAGTGNVIEAVRHMRLVTAGIAELKSRNNEALIAIAGRFANPYVTLLRELRESHGESATIAEHEVVFGDQTLDDITEGLYQTLLEVKKLQRLPVVNFAAGGIATPADAAMMMQLGCDGVFVGSGIFKSGNPEARGRSIVEAVTHFDDPSVVAEVSKGLGVAMKGLDISQIPAEERLQERGW